METMKFDEANPAEGGASREGENGEKNSNNNLNNEPTPKAPEGGVGDGGASGASAGEVSQGQGGAEEKRETEKETGGPEAKMAATNGTTIMPFQTDENNGKNDKNSENKRKKKLITAGAVLAVLILAVAGWQYWQYTQTPFYKQTQMVKAIDESLKESEKWGGKTPEETVALFTEAVKKGDFELASKYGILDLQSEIKKILTGYKNSEYWQSYLELLSATKKSSKKDYDFGPNSATFESFDDQNRRIVFISLAKNQDGIWKINEF